MEANQQDQAQKHKAHGRNVDQRRKAKLVGYKRHQRQRRNYHAIEERARNWRAADSRDKWTTNRY